MFQVLFTGFSFLLYLHSDITHKLHALLESEVYLFSELCWTEANNINFLGDFFKFTFKCKYLNIKTCCEWNLTRICFKSKI